MELIESLYSANNPVVVYPEDEAAVNAAIFAVDSSGKEVNATGRISGCNISMNGAGKFTISAGVLSVGGYRLKVSSSETLLNLSSSAAPQTDTKFKLVIRVTRSGHDATFSALAISGSPMNQKIWEADGSRDLLLGTFLWTNTGTFSGYTNAAPTLQVRFGGSSSTPTANSIGGLPQPQISLVEKLYDYETYGGEVGYSANPLICLSNIDDYYEYGKNYDIRFEVLRYCPGKRSRRTKLGSQKARYWKRGYFKPAMFGGVGNVFFVSGGARTSIKLEEVQNSSVPVTSLYNATNVLMESSEIIGYLFGAKVGSVWHSIINGMAYVNMANCRCSGAIKKKRVVSGSAVYHFSNNFVCICFQPVAYSGNKVVARGPMSAIVKIKPDPSAVARNLNVEGTDERCFIVEVEQ